MKRLWFFVLILAGALLLASLVGITPGGWVAFRIGDHEIELSLMSFVLFWIAGYVLLLGIFSLIDFTLRLPGRIGRTPGALAARRGGAQLIRGMIEMSEGHWMRGERRLVRFAPRSPAPLLNYLLAARAAQLQRADDRRDRYLKKAHESTPRAELAILLTQAELQIAHRQLEQALATLKTLVETHPEHRQSVRLLARTYTALSDWEALGQLWPRLKRLHCFSDDELRALERTLAVGRIRSASETGGRDEVLEVFHGYRKSLRERPEVIAALIEGLRRVEAGRAAVEELAELLPTVWSERWIVEFGHLAQDHALDLLARAEPWAESHPDSAGLNYVIGLLYRMRGRHGKARAHFERSLALRPEPETCLALSEFLDELGDHEGAGERARAGLHLLLDRAPAGSPDQRGSASERTDGVSAPNDSR
ncbi:HemY domain protein [mine drainage metagenome]|uniref:HemY domain protein n=1 Tax=mine drainage metagenome TaxID=410659 RepID=T1AHG3_9ZZZZ